MTENTDVRYVDTASATRTGINAERMDDQFEIEMSRAGTGAGARILEPVCGHARFRACLLRRVEKAAQS